MVKYILNLSHKLTLSQYKIEDLECMLKEKALSKGEHFYLSYLFQEEKKLYLQIENELEDSEREIQLLNHELGMYEVIMNDSNEIFYTKNPQN